jgi:hypothetical protein
VVFLSALAHTNVPRAANYLSLLGAATSDNTANTGMSPVVDSEQF